MKYIDLQCGDGSHRTRKAPTTEEARKQILEEVRKLGTTAFVARILNRRGEKP